MAIIRLTPSTYAVSNASYVTVTNPNNMYTNTDSNTYASLRNTRNSTSNTYYVYIRGFNFDDVPTNAEVLNFTIKLKGYESYMSTSSSYRMSLYNGNSAISNTTVTSSFSTTATTFTFPNGSLTWNTLKEYGSNFGIRVPLRRSSTSYNSYIYVYGAEIEVEYTIPNPINVTSVLVTGNGTLNPLGTTVTYEDAEYTLTITPTNKSDEVLLEKDGIDISAELEPHYNSANQQSESASPGSEVTTGFNRSGTAFYQNSSTQSDAWLRYAIGYSAENPYSTSNTNITYVKDGQNDVNTMGWMNYPFDFSGIPANATIESVDVKVYGAIESTSESASHADIELYSGNTLKSTRQSFTSTSNSRITINDPGAWDWQDLQDAQLRFIVGYYGGRILGATWTVYYSIPGQSDPDYYTYTFTVGDSDVLLEVSIGNVPYIPPEEDPTETYYSLTISSINADTDPPNGTTRVVEGSNQTITITPTDPQLTLALDNGVDITSQLQGGLPVNTYTVTTQVSGANYGFALDNSTGYYESTNQGVGSSASVCRVNFNLESDCLVTFNYIIYTSSSEANYDYCQFGAIDEALSTSNTRDSGVYHDGYGESSASVKTLTYELESGSHFIDIKYRKDSSYDEGNDSLQWKIASVEATSAGGGYTYTLTNINQKHSLIFVFGDVTFYYVNSSATSGGRIFPDGQQVKLPGDSYKINIVPDNINSAVTITDNGTNVTAQLEQKTGTDKNNNPVVSYSYNLSNIQATHNLFITIGEVSTQIYLKESGVWTPYSKVYKKINGSWVEQSDLSSVFSTSANYVKGN